MDETKGVWKGVGSGFPSLLLFLDVIDTHDGPYPDGIRPVFAMTYGQGDSRVFPAVSHPNLTEREGGIITPD